MNKKNIEHEVRFLEINEKEILNKLKELEAKDQGEEIVKEIIFYDKTLTWKDSNEFVRLRQDGQGTWLTYKQHKEFKIGGTIEIEFKVDNLDKAIELLQTIGLVMFRRQEKRRHSFIFNQAKVDIIEWPKVPALLEIEAESEEIIKNTAIKLGLDWNNTYYKDNRYVLEERYGIPFTNLKTYTFDKIE